MSRIVLMKMELQDYPNTVPYCMKFMKFFFLNFKNTQDRDRIWAKIILNCDIALEFYLNFCPFADILRTKCLAGYRGGTAFPCQAASSSGHDAGGTPGDRLPTPGEKSRRRQYQHEVRTSSF
jgi:hypothetical protein